MDFIDEHLSHWLVQSVRQSVREAFATDSHYYERARWKEGERLALHYFDYLYAKGVMEAYMQQDDVSETH